MKGSDSCEGKAEDPTVHGGASGFGSGLQPPGPGADGAGSVGRGSGPQASRPDRGLGQGEGRVLRGGLRGGFGVGEAGSAGKMLMHVHGLSPSWPVFR